MISNMGNEKCKLGTVNGQESAIIIKIRYEKVWVPQYVMVTGTVLIMGTVNVMVLVRAINKGNGNGNRNGQCLG
jgi:hypothetical protein